MTMQGPIIGRIPRYALTHLLPLARIGEWDEKQGCPRWIDWATTADWYDREVHWRGWIPENAMGTNIIPRPSITGIPRDPVIVHLKGREILSETTMDAAERLNKLRLALLDFLVDLKQLDIPVPESVATSIFNRTFRNAKELGVALCVLCYGMLDLVGFFKWVAAIFSAELESRNTSKFITTTYEWLDDNFRGRRIGYLVHLEAHRREFGFHFCIEQDVPFYYIWLQKYMRLPHLRRFDPVNLGIQSGSPDHTIPTNFYPYDQYLQGAGGLDNTPRYIDGMRKRVNFVIDFQGWVRRRVRKEEATRRMQDECYWEDYVYDGGGHFRFYLQWRLQKSSEADESENEQAYETSRYAPLHPDIIRERYKFICAPSHGDDISPLTYNRVHPQSLGQIRPDKPFLDEVPELALKSPPAPPLQSSCSVQHLQSPSLLSTGSVPVAPVAQAVSEGSLEAVTPCVPAPGEPSAVQPSDDLETIFDGPAIPAKDMPSTQPPEEVIEMDDLDDRVSLCADESLERWEIEGHRLAGEFNSLVFLICANPTTASRGAVSSDPSKDDKDVIISPSSSSDEDAVIVSPLRSSEALLAQRIGEQPWMPTAPKAMRSLVTNSKSSLSSRITPSVSLLSRMEVDLPGSDLIASPPRSGRHPSAGQLTRRAPVPSSGSSTRVNQKDDEHSPKRKQATQLMKPTWGKHCIPLEGRFDMPPSSRPPPHCGPAPPPMQAPNGRGELVGQLSIGNGKGKAKKTNFWTADQYAGNDHWGEDDAQYTSGFGTDTSADMSVSEWENSTGGWDANIISAWGRSPEHPEPRLSPLSALGTSDRPSESSSSKRLCDSPPPEKSPSTKRRVLQWARQDFTPLLSFYRTQYLEASPPLTTIEGGVGFHPYLSPDSMQQTTWNDQYIRSAIMHFPDARSEVKLRLWSLFAPLGPKELMQRALERHVPFGLSVRSDDAFLFRKEMYTDAESISLYYSPGFVTPYIAHSTDGFQLWNSYVLSVTNLLSRPHARALAFQGGLVSRLVQEFAPKSFYDGLAYGPSAQITRYGKGHTDPDRQTVDDELSTYDIGVILGTVIPPTGKDGIYSIWPSGSIFVDKFRGWNGEWTVECEQWFQDCLKEKRNKATVWPAREWRRFMAKVRVMNLPREVRQIPLATWDAALTRLRSDMVTEWQDNHLCTLGLPLCE